MGKLKLMTIIGTRPEIIRLSATIKCCDRYFDQILVHTGQNYDYTLNQVFFDDLGLRAPDFYLDAAGDDLGATIGNIVERSYKLMVREKPDAVLVLGDTNSCLSVIGAKRLHIPIFHMEAGNRCKDECLPEETNRRIVDIISDVNLCYSEHARRYLMECGLPKERTFVTGSPMAEVLRANLDKIEASSIHQRLGLTKKQYILLSAHREENIDSDRNFFQLFPAISIRTSTERPEALDAGCFVLAGIDAEPLLQAVEMAVGMQRAECFGTPVADYTAENVSMKVARIIQSCTGIVNKMVWRKDG